MQSNTLTHQFEVHCTAELRDTRPTPPGFWETRIQNFDRDGSLVQEYRLHTRRFQTMSEIPWELKEGYVRFKVERKIAKAQFETGQLEINEDYFASPLDSEGIEIHITSDVNADEHAHSSVDGAEHQSIFLDRREPLSRAELESMIESYRCKSKKFYAEAVLFDNNPRMDVEWRSACATT
jgi:hypothetical protein